MAFVASLIWCLADRYAGNRYSAPFYGYWNTGMHFTTFIVNAVTFAKIKSSLDKRHELERALAESWEQVKQLAGLIPPRHQSDTPCAPEPLPAEQEEYSALRPSEALAAPSCDDCRQRVVPANPSFLHEGDVGASVSP